MMQQPAAGVAPPPQMAPMSMDQQQQQPPPPPPQYQAAPPPQYQAALPQQYQAAPPHPQQQWMMMPPQQQQPPPPPQMWAQQRPPTPMPQQPQTQQQPPPQQQQQYQKTQNTGGSDEIRSLWIGDLQYWMEENYVWGCFSQCEAVSAKVIRNKQSGQTEGYGFIEFASRAAAERALQTYNGTLMPNSEQTFRLNWATLGAGERRTDDTPDYTIFVGDLASDVTDYLLTETFRPRYPSLKGAKVVTDRMTGRPKGYGFVRFGDESEQLRAMHEMNGILCSTRAMRIGPAATKKPADGQQHTKGHQEALILGRPGTDFS